MEQEVLNLANQHIQLAISNALNCLSQNIFTNSSSNQSLKSHVLLRYRSSSINRHKRKVPFHKTISRCSIPATKNDLVHYQKRFQTSLLKLNYNEINRIFDVQYSFSLLNKIHHQTQSDLNSIQNFVDEFVEHSIQTALLQVSLF